MCTKRWLHNHGNQYSRGNYHWSRRKMTRTRAWCNQAILIMQIYFTFRSHVEVFNIKDTKWTLRICANDVVTRMYLESPRQIEDFHQRLMLLLLRVPVATFFETLRTMERVEHAMAAVKHVYHDVSIQLYCECNATLVWIHTAWLKM